MKKENPNLILISKKGNTDNGKKIYLDETTNEIFIDGQIGRTSLANLEEVKKNAHYILNNK